MSIHSALRPSVAAVSLAVLLAMSAAPQAQDEFTAPLTALGSGEITAFASDPVLIAAIVAEEVERLVREDRFRSLAGESAEALISSRLTHLSQDDRETLLRFATGLAGRIARQPLDLAG